YELCSSPIEDSTGQIIGFIGVSLDITQRTLARAELERNRQEMTRTKHLTELGTISTAMTRQVERPLKVTQLLLERLLKEIDSATDSENIAKTLQKSLSEVNEAVSVLMRFSDFANLSAVTPGRPIDLQRFVRRVMAVCAESAKKVNLELVTEDLDVVPSVSIAESELEYVFLVLIQTAIEASDPDKPERLTISCEMSDKHLRLAFSDTCRAIPADQLKNVFQPFFSAHPDEKEVEFSLAVVSHIVNSAGGAITVESVANVGTAFHLTLPIGRAY
ncbi:MAG: sensor histidine kinase, partial [Planctomycetota bacterium]